MIGLSPHPDRPLVDRAVGFLQAGPQSAATLTRAVFGLDRAPDAIAERLAAALLGADPRVRQLDDGRWALVPATQGAPRLAQCAFAVVDVETTGTRARGDDRITEIAVVVVCDGRTELAFESLINPGRSIPPWVSRLTGITDALVRHAPRFEEVIDRVLAVLAGRVFVAHNAGFDWAFVSAEVRRARELALVGPRLCTVQLARRLVTGIRSRGLDALTHYFGLENPARHRAAGDALVTAQVLLRLLALAEERGARTLEDLAALRSPPRPRPSQGVNPVAEVDLEDC
ncbi:MAG TPA: 3'-5' exonuclease [Gemmatimonadales bacterium]|nr:3'-5' exonuclease [Gemmatimonadales bacterium]